MLTRDFQNNGSSARREKFLRPIHCMGETMFQRWKTSTIEKMSGYATNAQKNSTYGRTSQ